LPYLQRGIYTPQVVGLQPPGDTTAKKENMAEEKRDWGGGWSH